jgi:hypothetical protein
VAGRDEYIALNEESEPILEVMLTNAYSSYIPMNEILRMNVRKSMNAVNELEQL